MGFTFYIWPLRRAALSLEAIAEEAGELLRRYVASVPLERLIELSEELTEEVRAGLAGQAEQVRVTLGAVGGPSRTFGLEGEPAALAFSVEPDGGGGLVRRFGVEDPFARAASAAVRAAAAESSREAELEARQEAGAVFTVERVLGQPPLAVLAHGFVAAALAEACDGLAGADPGVWEEALWPCRGRELAQAFMRPERAASEEARRRAEAMLREVPRALAPADAGLLARVLDSIVGSLVREVNAVRGDGERELAAFDRALDRLDTARLLAWAAPVRERDLLLGAGVAAGPRGRPSSAFARLRPSPEEYQRWLAHLGERLA